MLERLVDAIFAHWCTVLSAPVPFIAIGTLGLVAGWLIRKSWDRDNVAHWRGLVAEYKDKLHDATPVEVATKINQLETKIADLEGDVSRQAQRTLTADQRKTLIEQLEQSPNTFALQYRVRPDDSEAIQYVMQFIATLYGIGKSFGAYVSCPEIPLDLQGLVIQVWDKQHIPIEATILAQALSASGITYRIDTLPTVYPRTLEPDRFALVIGHK